MRPKNFVNYKGTSIGFIEILDYKGNRKWECLCNKCGEVHLKTASLIKRLHEFSCCRKCSFKYENYSPRKINSLKERGRQGNHNKKYSGTSHISGHQLGHIKNHAASRGIIFSKDVTCEYLQTLLEKQNFKCALTGLDITHSPYNNDYYRKKGISTNYNTASLDRIDSSLGYEIGNVQWVHKDVQKMEWDLSLSRLIELCYLITVNRNNHGR